MDIYHYDQTTGQFLTSSVARLEPINDEPMIPANATTIVPPSVGSNQAAQWDGNAWVIVDNYRGYVGYDTSGVQQLINDLDVSPDPSWTLTPPFIFTDAFNAKLSQIQNAAIAAFSIITSTYLKEELDTFGTQESEAAAWRLDSNAATPTLDGIVANRPGITKQILVDRILDVNAPAYKAVSGAVMGKKQAMEDIIYALDPLTATQTDIDAIVVDFS